MPSISVIIPHYQKQQALEKTWDELYLQISPDDEVLIVDDNSPDGVPDLGCDCVKTIHLPKHEPHIWRLNTVRNYGLEHASNDWCIILDPDCVPNPRFMDNARKRVDPSVLFTGMIERVQKDGSVLHDNRDNSGKPYWGDLRDKRGAPIWGGCMMFSKSRTRLVDWFSEDYNGYWGCGESDFASKCYHSGMRLRYSPALKVTHQYHPKNREGYQRNRKLWLQKTETYANHLSTFTSYKPAVGVMVITLLRPELINQCIQSIFRNRMPVKVRLINNGDTDEKTRRICEQWGRRWAVDYVYHERKWPAVVRNESMDWAKRLGYKYIVSVDDDMIVRQRTITNLVREIEANPRYYAVSGFQVNRRLEDKYPIGGYIKETDDYVIFTRVQPKDRTQHVEWVGAGCTIQKMNPVVYYDERYKTGFNDYDWCMEIRKRGLKVATTGYAGAYHKFILTPSGMKRYKVPPRYHELRYDDERNAENNELFYHKWGKHILTRRNAEKEGLL